MVNTMSSTKDRGLGLSRIGTLILKLVVTGALLWLVFRKVDVGTLAGRLGSLDPAWAIVALVVLFVLLVLTGIRWYFVDRSIGSGIGLRLAVRLALVGHCFNQLLPSSVGGDGVRAWMLSRGGVPIRRALASVICDRVVALVVLTTIVAATLPLVVAIGGATIPSATSLTVAVDTSTIGGLLFLHVFGEAFSSWLMRVSWMRPLGVVIHDLARVLFHSDVSGRVILLSVLAQTLLPLGIYFCALALDVRFGLVHLLMLPLIMLVASIPISFAGWGLRESAMVTGLGFAGISAHDALAISVCFGGAQLIVGLPGLVIAVMSGYRGGRTSGRIAD